MELSDLKAYAYEGGKLEEQTYFLLDSPFLREALRIDAGNTQEIYDNTGPMTHWYFNFIDITTFEENHSKLFHYLTLPYWSRYETAYLLNYSHNMNILQLPVPQLLDAPEFRFAIEQIERFAEIGEIKRKGKGIDPQSALRWAAKNNVKPEILDLKHWLTDDEIKERGFSENSEEKIENEEPLTAQECRELGTLRQQRDKWESSIKAGVHAALFTKKGKIKRGDLKDELYKFDLPDTTIEIIWKALRDEGLTMGAGRPKSSK